MRLPFAPAALLLPLSCAHPLPPPFVRPPARGLAKPVSFVVAVAAAKRDAASPEFVGTLTNTGEQVLRVATIALDTVRVESLVCNGAAVVGRRWFLDHCEPESCTERALNALVGSFRDLAPRQSTEVTFPLDLESLESDDGVALGPDDNVVREIGDRVVLRSYPLPRPSHCVVRFSYRPKRYVTSLDWSATSDEVAFDVPPPR